MSNDNRPSIESLFLDLEHPNPNINEQAFFHMKRFWPKESKTRLLQNLDSKNVQIRRKSIKALSHFGVDIVDEIVQIYFSRHNNILKISCLKILVLIASRYELNRSIEKIEVLIQSAIKDDSPEITLIVISLLRQIGKDSLPKLKTLCRDKNLLRAKAAITALQEISDESNDAFLKDLLLDYNVDQFLRDCIIENMRVEENVL